MSYTLSRRLARRAGVALAGLVAATVVTLPGTAQAATTPSHLTLTPTSTPAVSQNITFRAHTAGATKGIVEYRKQGTSQIQAVETANNPGFTGWAHASATLAGLAPGSTYYYRVGSRLALSSQYTYSTWRSFSTAKTGASDFEFVAFGDTNEKAAADSRWADIVTKARTAAPQMALTLHTGDIVQQVNNKDHWGAWNTGLGTAASINAFTTVGENEAFDDTLSSYKAMVTNPATSPAGYEEAAWYSDYQNVRFISLDTTVNDSRIQAQAAWLGQVLAANRSRWTVVSLHNSPFTTSTAASDASTLVRTHILPLLKQHSVDVVFSGHEGVSATGVVNSSEPTDSGPLFVTNNSGGVDGTLAPSATNGWATNSATALTRAEKVDTYSVVKVTTAGLSVSTRVAGVRSGAAAFAGNTSVDVNTLQGTELGAVDVLKTKDGTKKAIVEEGGTVPGFIVNDTTTPTVPNPGTSNPTPGSPSVPPTTGGSTTGGQVAGTSTVNRGKVTVKKVSAVRGKKLKVKVKGTVSGTVVLKVKHGRKTLTRKVKVTAGRWKKVTFAKKLAKRGKPVLKVRATLKPTRIKVKGKWTQPKSVSTRWVKVKIRKR